MTFEKKKVILFVDDEESILEIASEYFIRKGYHVLTASNGLEAIDVLEKEVVDCCFTDINMPEMGGLELAEYIRRVDNTLPVIVMTGFPSLDTTINTMKNGVVDFLIKPVNLDQMEFCVQRVLRERKLFVDNMFLKKEVESKERLEKLNAELLNKIDELNILNKIMNDFSSISSTDLVFNMVVKMACDISYGDEARFFVINSELQKPVEVALFGDSSRGDENIPTSIEAVVMEVASDKIPFIVTENNGSCGLSPKIKSFMAVPLKIRGKVFGVLATSVIDGIIRFEDRNLYYLSFMTQKAAAAIENLALYENIYNNLFSTLYAFVATLEVRDAYTNQHSARVSQLSVMTGKKMGLGEEELNVLDVAGRLHDIGKIGIRDEILLKPGRLDRAEFEIIKEHPVIGAGIVAKLGLWDREQEIIRFHHERFDGKGYPDGICGEEIPLLARVLAVADAYDAMASDRAYRSRLGISKIRDILSENSGTQFDSNVVDIFLSLMDDGSIEEFYS